MGTWMAWANEDPSKLLCKRTCNFIFRSTWHEAKPRTPTTTIFFYTVATICVFAETMSNQVMKIIQENFHYS